MIGEYLKEQRKHLNYSLENISIETKISIEHLQAIENEEFEKIPSEVFVYGYINQYMNALSLDPDEALSLYKEYTRQHPRKRKSSYIIAQKNPFLPKLILLLIFLTTILIIYQVSQKLLHVTSKIENSAQSNERNTPAPLASSNNTNSVLPPAPSETNLNVETMVITGNLENNVIESTLAETDNNINNTKPIPPDIALNEESTNTNDEKIKNINSTSRPNITAESPLSENIALTDPIKEKLPNIADPTLANTNNDNMTSLDDTEEDSSNNHILDITAIEETWVFVKMDGNKIDSALMKEGQTKQWRAKKKFFMKIGNAGGIIITMDGKKIGIPGERGHVIKLNLPESGTGEVEE